MIKGSDYLRYDLYSDNARATIWGGTGAGYSGYTGTGTSGTVTVYGRVAASQNAPVGSYSDSVTVTITF
jgi:spore coat protein U-like protein